MTKRTKKPLWIVVLILPILLVLAILGFWLTPRCLYPIPYENEVLAASETYQLPPSLIYGVIRTESSFRPDAVSSVGAIGLMQITEETFEWIQYRKQDYSHSYEDLFDPAISIDYGSFLLRLLLDEFGSQPLALCAYHAGWGNVTSWLENPLYLNDGFSLNTIPFLDTAHYVSKVEKAQNKYCEIYDLA